MKDHNPTLSKVLFVLVTWVLFLESAYINWSQEFKSRLSQTDSSWIQNIKCFVFSCSLCNHEQPKWDLVSLKLVWLPGTSGLQGFLAQALSERNKTGLGLVSALKWYSHICMALPLMQLSLVSIWESDKPPRMTNIRLQYLFLASPKGGLVPRAHSVIYPPTGLWPWDFGCVCGELGLWVFCSFLCKGWPHSVCLHSYFGLLIKSYSQLSWLRVDYFFPFPWVGFFNYILQRSQSQSDLKGGINSTENKQSSTLICENRLVMILMADLSHVS